MKWNSSLLSVSDPTNPTEFLKEKFNSRVNQIDTCQVNMEVPRKPFRYFCLTCSKAYNCEMICHGEKVVDSASADYLPKTIIMNKPYLTGNNSGEQLNRTLEK